MAFPEYLLLSRNYYESSWASTAKKRLKNIVAVMEWVPDAAELSISGQARTVRDSLTEISDDVLQPCSVISIVSPTVGDIYLSAGVLEFDSRPATS